VNREGLSAAERSTVLAEYRQQVENGRRTAHLKERFYKASKSKREGKARINI
jgi:hypothetical protein